MGPAAGQHDDQRDGDRSGCGRREVAEHDDERDRGQSRGRKLTLKYQDGEKTVVLPPDVTVVKLEPADRSQLKPGVHLFAIASRQPDGRSVRSA